LWLRQMAAMLVDIETVLLTEKERGNAKWFPRWFNYLMTEEEKHVWEKDEQEFKFEATGSEVYNRSSYALFSDIEN
jgi:hypothetical protein